MAIGPTQTVGEYLVETILARTQEAARALGISPSTGGTPEYASLLMSGLKSVTSNSALIRGFEGLIERVEGKKVSVPSSPKGTFTPRPGIAIVPLRPFESHNYTLGQLAVYYDRDYAISTTRPSGEGNHLAPRSTDDARFASIEEIRQFVAALRASDIQVLLKALS